MIDHYVILQLFLLAVFTVLKSATSAMNGYTYVHGSVSVSVFRKNSQELRQKWLDTHDFLCGAFLLLTNFTATRHGAGWCCMGWGGWPPLVVFLLTIFTISPFFLQIPSFNDTLLDYLWFISFGSFSPKRTTNFLILVLPFIFLLWSIFLEKGAQSTICFCQYSASQINLGARVETTDDYLSLHTYIVCYSTGMMVPVLVPVLHALCMVLLLQYYSTVCGTAVHTYCMRSVKRS